MEIPQKKIKDKKYNNTPEYNKKYYENWNPVGKYNFGKVIPHAERFRIMAKSIFKATKILNLGFV